MAHISRIAQLLAKKMRGMLSAPEQEELDSWLRESPDHQTFMDTRMRPDIFARGQSGLWEMNEESLDKKMNRALRRSPYFSYARSRKWARIIGWSAAAVIGGIVFSIHLFRERPYTENHTEETETFCKDTSTVNTPKLAIHAGKSILLDTMHKTTTLRYGSLILIKTGDHRLDVRWAETIDPLKETSINYTLSIPLEDENWQLFLPENSRLDLHPGTSLAFYINAIGNKIRKRVITLNGYAYFEIAPVPNVPLYIETLRGETTVLGTIFNLRDYPKEDSLTLSLFKGRLNICNGQDIKPLDAAHQATIHTGRDIKIVKNSSLPEKVLWDDDAFDFKDKNLVEAMAGIARHYHLKVQFKDNVDIKTRHNILEGQPEKSLTIGQLLHSLNGGPDLFFKIQGDTIIVSKPSDNDLSESTQTRHDH